jgi:hypothetical protein
VTIPSDKSWNEAGAGEAHPSGQSVRSRALYRATTGTRRSSEWSTHRQTYVADRVYLAEEIESKTKEQR